MKREVPELTRLEHILLSALATHERYGLEIVETVRKAIGVSLSLGGLYTTLHRMERKQLVESRWGETTEEREGARRRYYKATGLGIRALAKEQGLLRRAWRMSPSGARLAFDEGV
ncbi:MAG: PadR family transcriptional regulator [Candidatus Rokuibacteriota bacterium]